MVDIVLLIGFCWWFMRKFFSLGTKNSFYTNLPLA